MDIDTILEHCMKKPGTEETLPFGPDVLVLKVNGKATTVDAPPNTLLVQVLREHLKLTGTHVG